MTIRGRDSIAPVRASAKRKVPRVNVEKQNPSATRANPTSDSLEREGRTDKPTINENSDDDNLVGTSGSLPPSASKPNKNLVTADAYNNNDDEEDDDSPFGSPGDDDSPPSSKAPRKNRFIDDEAADGDDDADGYEDNFSGRPGDDSPVRPRNSAAEASSPMAGGDGEFDDEDDDDIEDMPPPYRSHAPPSYAKLKLPEAQAPFAPSSTPLDLTRRFLCWNHIGSVTRLLSDDGRALVDVDFTDSAFRRPISFTDNLGFVLGSLGEDGGIFCTDLLEDNDTNPDVDELLHGLSEATKLAVKKSHQSRMRGGSKGKPMGSSIYFHRFESTVGNIRDKDWHLTLPNDERALGCACGEGWAAVVTSRRFLRLYSSGGNQGRIHWLPGEPVTMAGRSRFLIVVYHEATPLPDGTQKLGYVFMDAQSQGRILHKGSLSCVSKASSLTWIGLSSDQSVMAMDSDGMLSMLASTGSAAAELDSKTSHWEWMPVLDSVGLRKTAEDNFWPITVYDGKLVCVPLKGGTRHPDATRRPVTTSLSVRLPLARGPLIRT
jgi:chromosome transmission fidelity protein 4